jgi:hypothetical protein
MKINDAIAWFKTTFQKEIKDAIADTPFSMDLIAAIAVQETGYLWMPLVSKLELPDLLKVCVGDTIDAPGRGAFPKTKSDLTAATRGEEMFQIARDALEEIGKHDRSYGKIAERNSNKFCHGFGIFQYDLQFFKENPDFFLKKKWHDFSECLGIFLGELRAAMRRAFGSAKTTLTDTEQVFVAIAYNRGSVNLAKGFKQGFKNDEGQFYGENVFEYMSIARAIPLTAPPSPGSSPDPSTTPLAPPTPIDVTGNVFRVNVHSVLNLRSKPALTGDIIARLPSGQLVHAVSERKGDKFMEVETSLHGAHFRGFAAREFLEPAKEVEELPVIAPSPEEPASGIVAVYMPRKPGTTTKRTEVAGAHSLNEAGQPGRSGTTVAERCAELAAIIDWLAVDKAANKRYQPTTTATFCNIYVHDYCFLAGIYLPRVWWLPGAIERLARGETVEPLYEKTIDEQRANDIFRWLRDFGARFGWRQTSTPTKLQEAANLGGIGIIVARRKLEGRSGHIVVVVPETTDEAAKRNSTGEVTAPLQSQAGSVNFRYGTGRPDWWKGDQFADSAFWIHT